MPGNVLLLHADPASAQPLVEFFHHHGQRTTQTQTPAEALRLLGELEPGLLVVDLHLPGNDWLNVIQETRERFPATHILITNQYPDLRRELMAKELGCQVFLRQPFTAVWIQRALEQLDGHTPRPAQDFQLPRVRVPVRFKVILPFALLAAIFAMAAAYLISQYVVDSIRERFERQLLDAATLTSDGMVREESRLLETVRAVANTAGVAQALQARDAEALRRLVLPIAVNAQEDAIDLVDAQGVSLLSLRKLANGDYQATRGDATFADWPFVQAVLGQRADQEGDKFAGVAEVPEGPYFYVAGPVLAPGGELVGVVLVGEPLEALARHIRTETLAHVSFYADDGRRLASTLSGDAEQSNLPAAEAAEVLRRQAGESYIRLLAHTSADYSEVLGPWLARNGERLGLVGTALAQNFNTQPTLVTQLQSFGFVLAGILMVAVIGWILADHITRPLGKMVRAAREVAQGNFQIRLQDYGNDEVAVLVQAFNRMVTGLQEGSIYRDLLGRTVSPEVREQLRGSFASGDLHLEGQTVIATVLMTDIRGFTTLSEKAEPQVVLKWLNEYFGELAPIIAAHGGVIDKFEGDAMLAFFGVLPRPMPPRESAFQACQAALEMLKAIEHINARRAERGEPLFITGIGLNTGKVTAGGLGASDRLNYTIIGDVVNTTQRIESFTRQFSTSAVVISETTYNALRARQAMFQMESLGAHMFKGKSEPVTVYHLLPAAAPVEGLNEPVSDGHYQPAA